MIIAASFDINDPELWNNRALQYGDGLFETMRCHRGDLPLWDFHVKRALWGLKALSLNPPDFSDLYETIITECDAFNHADYVVKLVIFRQHKNRTYQPQSHDIDWFISVTPFAQSRANQAFTLACASFKLSQQPALAGIKHLSRLEQVMAAAELNTLEGVDDLLVFDHNNRLIESSCQNVVLLRSGQLFTPDLTQCGVSGVALDWLKTEFEVVTQVINLDQLRYFDGMLLCNAVRGFTVVKKIKELQSFSTSHAIHDKIKHHWNKLLKS